MFPFFLSKSTFRPLIELDEGQNRAALRKDHFFSNEKRLHGKVTFRCAKHITNLIFIHILDSFINGLYLMLDIKKR